MSIFLNFSRPHCVIGSFGEKRGMLPEIAVENFNVGLMLGWDVRGYLAGLGLLRLLICDQARREASKYHRCYPCASPPGFFFPFGELCTTSFYFQGMHKK